MPHEEREVASPQVWKSFGTRVAEAISPLVGGPLIGEWWPSVVHAESNSSKLGRALAQARHRLELDWGSRTLELPQSHVCQTRPFRWFALHLLANADALRSAYNGALAGYRSAHRLRSPAQPLPDLQQTDGWTETPFWIWKAEQPRRRALFTRHDGGDLALTDLAGWQTRMPSPTANRIDAAVDGLAELEAAGVKIRTRALITTLYARLLLADSFIHGIGGAKYDQVTDQLCQSFFGVELPPYVALSGTLRLPIEHQTVSPSRVSCAEKEASRLAIPSGETRSRRRTCRPISGRTLTTWSNLNADGCKLLRRVRTPLSVTRNLRRRNAALQPWLSAERDRYEGELATTVSQTRVNRLLESREYPFLPISTSATSRFFCWISRRGCLNLRAGQRKFTYARNKWLSRAGSPRVGGRTLATERLCQR